MKDLKHPHDHLITALYEAVAYATQELTMELENTNEELRNANEKVKKLSNIARNLRKDLDGMVRSNETLFAVVTELNCEVSDLKRQNHTLANERNAAIASNEALVKDREVLKGFIKSNNAAHDKVVDRLNACEFVLNSMGITVKYKQ